MFRRQAQGRRAQASAYCILVAVRLASGVGCIGEQVGGRLYPIETFTSSRHMQQSENTKIAAPSLDHPFDRCRKTDCAPLCLARSKNSLFIVPVLTLPADNFRSRCCSSLSGAFVDVEQMPRTTPQSQNRHQHTKSILCRYQLPLSGE